MKLIVTEFSAVAIRQMAAAIKSAKRPKKCGKTCGTRNAPLHRDRNAILSELRRRHAKSKRPIVQIIREMRNDSAYSARMRGVSVSSWRAYYYRK